MSNEILIQTFRDPFCGMTRDQYVEEVRKRLAGRVEEGYFFGSITGKDFHKESDIDMILISPSTKPFQDRAMDFADLLDLVPTTDILVYTKEEFASLMEDPSPGFWRSVKSSLKRFI